MMRLVLSLLTMRVIVALHVLELTRRASLGAVWNSAVGTLLISNHKNHDINEKRPVEEIPTFLKAFTRLAPLGPFQATSNSNHHDKVSGVSLAEIKDRLEIDLIQGYTGKGGYILTGDLCPEIFRDDCIFSDPTTELLDPLQVNDNDRTLTGRFRSRGYLRLLPWHPYVTAYESTIVYTVDDTGLISRQQQVWTKSAIEALQESFTPSFVGRPRQCNLSRPTDEPNDVTKLFHIVNGRRPYEYSVEERQNVDTLLHSIASQSYAWNAELLVGTWILAYLKPGPNGATIDRRIPFPDVPFNDNFQTFGSSTVQNTGQLLGPFASVQVYGDLYQVDDKQQQTPKRYQADIHSGRFCVQQQCPISLPISGQGLFDGVYLGQRLRIGQNINGGGAWVVQLRVA